MSSLHKKAFGSLAIFCVVMAAILFACAGTLDYWQGWTFLAAYFAASIAVTLYLIKHDPALLERRMSGGPFAEKEPVQKIIMWLMSLGFIALIAVPALDHRFGWSHPSPLEELAGNVLVLLGYLGIFFVFRENSFAATTIQSPRDQRVISTGPYAWVRHPMYATALVILLGMPIALGSWWGVLIVVALIPALIWRLLDEERFLTQNLSGYVAYQETVRYRLLPWIW